jgi:hypothetical protein
VTTAAAEIQTAVYTKLTGDAELTALVSGVFDEVPEGTEYPYVVLGDIMETPSEASEQTGTNTTATIHVWSKQRGNKQTADLLRHVDRVLHREPLTVDGFTNVSVTNTFLHILRDPDPAIRHGVARFRIWTQKEEMI